MLGKLSPMAPGLFEQGCSCLERHQYAEAIKIFTEIISCCPTMGPAFLNRAEAYRSLGQYQEALDDATKAVNLLPKNWRVFYCRGLVYSLLEQYDKAIEDYDRALNFKPSEDQLPRILYARGFSLFHKKQFLKAIEDLNRAHRHGFQGPDIYRFRGIAYFKIDNFPEAIANFKQLIQLKQADTDILAYQALSCIRAGDRAATAKSLEILAACFPEDQTDFSFLVLQVFGEARLMARKYEEALQYFESARKKCSTEADIYLGRAEAYRMLMRCDEALRECDQAERLATSEDVRVFRLRGSIHLVSGQFEKAVHYYTGVIKINKEDVGTWISRGTALMRSKKYKEAEANFKVADGLRPGDQALQLQFGRLYFLQGDYQKSITFFEAVLANDQECSQAFSGRGTAMAFLNRMEEATADFNKARKFDKVTGDVCLGRGKIKFVQGKFDEAIERFDAAIKFDGTDYWAYFLRGQAKAQQKQFAEAIKDFDGAIERSPPHNLPDFYFEKAEALRKAKRYEEAIHVYNQSTSLRGGTYSGRAFSNLARGCQPEALLDLYYIFENFSVEEQAEFFKMLEVLGVSIVADAYCLRARMKQRSGKHSEAIPDFEQALTEQFSCAETYAGLAQSKASLGDYSGAVKAYGRAIILDDTRADYFLERAELQQRMNLEAKPDYIQALKLSPETIRATFYRRRPEWFFRENFQSILLAMLNEFFEKNEKAFEKGMGKLKGPAAKYSKIFMSGVNKLQEARHDINGVAAKALEDFNRVFTWIVWLPFLKGCAYLILGKIHEALEFFQQSRGPYALFFKANAHRLLGQHHEAIADLNVAIQLGLTHEACYFMRGLSYAALGDYESAQLDFSWAGNHPWVRSADGFLKLIFADYGQAILDFDAALRLDPHELPARWGRGEANRLLHRYDQAKADLDVDFKNSAAYCSRGRLLLECGQWAEAIKVLSEAINLDSKNAEAFEARSRAHDLMGDHAAAQKDRDAAAQLDLSHPPIWIFRSELVPILDVIPEVGDLMPHCQNSSSKAWANQFFSSIQSSVSAFFRTHQSRDDNRLGSRYPFARE